MTLEDLFEAISLEFPYFGRNTTTDGIPFFVVRCNNKPEFNSVFQTIDEVIDEKRHVPVKNARTYAESVRNVAVYLHKHGPIRCTKAWERSVPYQDYIRIWDSLHDEPEVLGLPDFSALLSEVLAPDD